jgi:GTP pyrophosphokinase
MSKLREMYTQRFDGALQPLAPLLEKHIQEYFDDQPRIDRISARPKSVAKFLAKAEKSDAGKPKYSEPLQQIQDQLAARIVTFYHSDVDRVSSIVLRYFQPIETRDLVPESEWEFGYFGRHFVLLLPSDILRGSIDRTLVPQFFELQVKTLFQHAWSEANHDLGYKPQMGHLPPQARRLAYTSAQAWGADHMFDELFRESWA